MKTFKKGITEIAVFVSGAIMLVVGLSITFAPAGFYASSGIQLGNSASLINELRAPAGMLVTAGAIVLASLRVKSIRPQALLISSLVYLPYGVGRLIGFAVEGMPHSSIVAAAAVELTLGTISLLLLLNLQRPLGELENEAVLPIGQLQQ